MKGKGFDFEAFAVEEGKTENDKAYWTRIGAAWINKDSITISLNALPVNRKIVLLKPRPKEEKKPEQKMSVFGSGG